jgi:hypothetical protein
MRMPSPFLDQLMRMNGYSRGSGGLPQAIVYGQSYRPRQIDMPKKGQYKVTYEQSEAEDRRLPMLRRIRGAESAYSDIPLGESGSNNRVAIGVDHIRYLGENMVCYLNMMTYWILTTYRSRNCYRLIWGKHIMWKGIGQAFCVAGLVILPTAAPLIPHPSLLEIRSPQAV